MSKERDFKGIWIPKSIWLSKELSLQEKVFLVEINSLDGSSGCFASNEYFAEFFGLSKSRVSEVINSLINKGFLISIIHSDEGNTRTLEVIAFPEDPLLLSRRPSSPIPNDNNTVNNTFNNNKDIMKDEMFESFWTAYPKKEARAKALIAWKKAKITEVLMPVILHAIDARKKTDQWIKEKGQFIPLPATYINQRRWEDEVELPKSYIRPDYVKSENEDKW